MRSIYLAGKVGNYCWRHGMVQGLNRAYCVVGGDTPEPWPVLEGAGPGGLDYVGPFFSGCDHSCGHQPGEHGLAPCGCNGGCDQQFVVEQCLRAVKKADVVFAWIDDPSCYGSIFELGFAAGLGKTIVVGTNLKDTDLWFMMRYAYEQRSLYPAETPTEAFQMFYYDLQPSLPCGVKL